MTSAENVDAKRTFSRFHDYTLDATGRMPFESRTFSVAHAINPYGFNPVNPETARILRPGGILIVSGGVANKYTKVNSELAAASGLKLLEVIEHQIPQHRFGVQRYTSGDPQKGGQTYRTVIYFKPRTSGE